MKNLKLIIAAFLIFNYAFLISQTFPYGINYQAVARDANGNAISTATLNLRFTIAPSTSTTAIVYQETQTASTNKMGQFNAVIGTGSSSQTFSNVPWQGNAYNLIVEINPGSGYTIIGNQPFQSVPYALAVKLKAPTIQIFTSGAGIYTAPAGVLYIEVEMVGGGGGGAGDATGGTPGTPGGNTTFGTSLLVANGGQPGAQPNAGSGGLGGTASLGSITTGLALTGASGSASGLGTTASGVFPSGGAGGSSPFGGAAGFSIGPNNGSSASLNTGSGGAGGAVTVDAGNSAGGGGGAGGYIKVLIGSPEATYSYSIGTGGTGGNAGSRISAGGNGGSGIIIVREYYQ